MFSKLLKRVSQRTESDAQFRQFKEGTMRFHLIGLEIWLREVPEEALLDMRDTSLQMYGQELERIHENFRKVLAKAQKAFDESSGAA